MTQRELAQKLQLSPAALSLILNNKPGVSSATRARVIEQIEQMGYAHLLRNITPFGQSFPNPPGGQLCFVIYKRHGRILNQHPYFMLLMESIEERARKHGYSVLLMSMEHNSYIDKQIETLHNMHVRGIILFATEMQPEDLKPFDALRLPLVALDNHFHRTEVNTVSIDNDMGTYQAIAHLVSMGHKSIGYLQSDVSISSFDERAAGYRSALDEFGLPPSDVFRIPYSEAESYRAFRSILLEKPKLPTAFVSDDDTIATGVMRALTEAGLHIPDDISIVGFNDRPSCEAASPALTSVNVPRASFGAEAVDALMKLIGRSDRQSTMVRSLKLRIGTQLVSRDSVKQL